MHAGRAADAPGVGLTIKTCGDYLGQVEMPFAQGAAVHAFDAQQRRIVSGRGAGMVLSQLIVVEAELPGMQLVDFKIECGRLFEGDMMRIILADEISPDSCRLMDLATRQRLDSRVEGGDGVAVSAYSEVARRLGIMNENEPTRAAGPVLVK